MFEERGVVGWGWAIGVGMNQMGCNGIANVR